MDATLDGLDWDALDRRFVPPALREAALMPLHLDRESAVRAVLAARSTSRGDDGPGSGLADRLAAVIAWARVDVPVAVLAAGHTHAENIVGSAASRYLRSDAVWTVWTVWPAEPPPLRASAAGPVYRLDGVVSRPLGGGITTHAIVAAQSVDGTMLFAVDIRHPRVLVMADVAAAVGSPVEYSGAFRFEGVPATPLPHPMPPRDEARRHMRLSSAALVVGAAAGLADEVVAVTAAGSGSHGVAGGPVVHGLAARLLSAGRAIDATGTGRPPPWLDMEIIDLGAGIRAAAADLLELGRRVDGQPGSPGAERAAQLQLALRLEARAP